MMSRCQVPTTTGSERHESSSTSWNALHLSNWDLLTNLCKDAGWVEMISQAQVDDYGLINKETGDSRRKATYTYDESLWELFRFTFDLDDDYGT
jgi:hypothetical protein